MTLNNILQLLAGQDGLQDTDLTGHQILWSLLFDDVAYSRVFAVEEGLSNLRQIKMKSISDDRYEAILPDGAVIHGRFASGNNGDLVFDWSEGSLWEPLVLFDLLPECRQSATIAKNSLRRGSASSPYSLAASPKNRGEDWHAFDVTLGLAFHLSGGPSQQEVVVTLLCPEQDVIPQAIELRFEDLMIEDENAILIRNLSDCDVTIEVCDRMDLESSERELLSRFASRPRQVTVIRTFFRVPDSIHSNQWSSLIAYGDVVASPMSRPGQATRVTKAIDGTRMAIRRPNRFFDSSQGFLLTVGESRSLAESAFQMASSMQRRADEKLGPTDGDEAVQNTAKRLVETIQSGAETSLLSDCHERKIGYVSKSLSNAIRDVVRQRQRSTTHPTSPITDGLPESLLFARKHDPLHGLGDVLPGLLPGFDLTSWERLRSYAQDVLAESLANGELEERDWEALQIRMLEGLNWDVIAERLGCHPKTLRSRIHRFFKKLHNRIDPPDSE